MSPRFGCRMRVVDVIPARAPEPGETPPEEREVEVERITLAAVDPAPNEDHAAFPDLARIASVGILLNDAGTLGRFRKGADFYVAFMEAPAAELAEPPADAETKPPESESIAPKSESAAPPNETTAGGGAPPEAPKT
jgi:hypothetical protein